MNINLENAKIVDLTHNLTHEISHWGIDCGFQLKVKTDYEDCKSKLKFRVQDITMHAGIGTHLDAPLHCFSNSASVAEIPLETLISPCLVIDVSEKVHETYSVSKV